MIKNCLRCSQPRVHIARGLCMPCYNSLRGRHGRVATFSDQYPLREKRPDGHRRIESNGYVTVMVNGRGLHEHRYVMEELLGRMLIPGETVHHRNGDKTDNSPENLELWWKPQPAGQRVEELLRYAVAMHRDALQALLQ